MSISTVLSGEKLWHVERGDCIEWLASLPEGCASLAFFSPPYEAARSYSIGFNLTDQVWVDWMVQVFQAALRATRGLVACVCEGKTQDYRWSATPALLMADLHRAGVCLRRPCIYRRSGIPGSGGPDWLRADAEFIVCATRPGRLPWSDNTACGRPPKWAPGGEMSHRLADGARVNQWGMNGKVGNRPDGKPTKHVGEFWPSHVVRPHTKTRRRQGTDEIEHQSYTPPAIANPGNVIDCNVGGGQMGSSLAHENEAPFPESLAEFFVRSFCPPGGLVIDCFSGSGTTGACAIRWGRRFLGCDIRQSQVDLSCKRISRVTPDMFAVEEAKAAAERTMPQQVDLFIGEEDKS